MIRQEPVVTTATLAVLLNAGVAYLLPHAEVPVRAALVSLLLVPAVWVARRFSFSEETIRQAGLDPDAVQARADNPSVPRCDA